MKIGIIIAYGCCAILIVCFVVAIILYVTNTLPPFGNYHFSMDDNMQNYSNFSDDDMAHLVNTMSNTNQNIPKS